MFQNFKISYITCTFFTNFIYNEYIGLYFLSHVVSNFFANAPPTRGPHHCIADVSLYLRWTTFWGSKLMYPQGENIVEALYFDKKNKK